MFGAAAAIAGAAAAYQVELSKLPPGEWTEIMRRQRKARELAAIDAESEVQLARSLIHKEGLRGAHAETLLNFARDLVRRRIS